MNNNFRIDNEVEPFEQPYPGIFTAAQPWEERQEGLERRVEERTAALSQANAALQAEIAERRRAEEQLRRLNRAHLALTRCNQALIRATEEAALLQEMCRIIVEVAGYRLCWVGYAEPDQAKTVRPVAQAGYEQGYLETVNVTWADTERGRGPVGTAIRTRATSLFKDAATDAAFAPWRAEALKRGYASVLGIPLMAGADLLGALTIYASEPNAFDAEEVGLLEGLANDLVYGVTALHARAERIKAREALRQAHDELERRVAERTTELAQANQRMLQDIAERQRAEEALAQERYLLHCLMDTVPDSIYFKDRESRFIRVNRAQAKWVGLGEPDRVLGKTDFDLFTDEHAQQAYQDEQEIMRTGQAVEGKEEKETWPDGRVTWVSTTKVPLRNPQGGVIGTFGISRDITRRKHAEEELCQAKEAAECASRAKSEFLAVMSHEIRTPMNGILGMTELALDTDLTPEQREYLTLVKKSADALLSVINAILDFSKIEAGKVELDHTPFSLRDCLGDALNTLAVRAHQKELELACHIAPDVPDALVGDPGRLRQILVNLVGNALKFTEQGEVVVEVKSEIRNPKSETTPKAQIPRTEGASVPVSELRPSGLGFVSDFGFRISDLPGEVALQFSVKDTGIGIPVEKQRSVFDPFSQVDNSLTRRYEGTGLGLAISTRLVELMGGQLALESVPGQGSTFHFTVGFERPQGPAERSAPAAPAQVLGLPVLVVDDNATNRRILEELLSHGGLKPTVVDGGRSALAALERAHQAGEPFGLVLLDARMPEMDGFRLAECLQQHPELNGAPIILLSSASHPGQSRRCRELGVAECLAKPIKQADLWRAIFRVLGAAGPDEQPAHESVPAGPRRRLRILLAEDNPVNQKLAVGLLVKQGHTVALANNGREALVALEHQRFDLVLMDVQMPEMDGLRATAAIRAQEQAAGTHVPIIAMTAYAMKGDRERCLQAGMDGYIAKPVHGKELLQVIEAVVGPASGRETEPEPEIPAGAARDWSAVLTLLNGDRELLHELARVFLEECPRWMAEIRTALAQGDPSRLQFTAHTLKGSLSLFAAQAAVEAALRLETMGRQADLEGAGETWVVLVHEVEGLQSALAALAEDNGDLELTDKVGKLGSETRPGP